MDNDNRLWVKSRVAFGKPEHRLSNNLRMHASLHDESSSKTALTLICPFMVGMQRNKQSS